MRIKHSSTKIHEGDLTPMIDMTFQLIAFFMVLINFSQNDQNVEIELPLSALAKPPEQAAEYPLTLQLTETNEVIVGGQTVPLGGVRFHLIRERNILENKKKSRGRRHGHHTSASVRKNGNRAGADEDLPGHAVREIRVAGQTGYWVLTPRPSPAQ